MNRFGPPFVLFVLLALVVAPAPQFAAAQEKKPIAEPKKEAPDIDYQALLNDRLGKGITPEKNAVVLLWKAFGPTPSGALTRMPAEFFKRLGIVEPPQEGECFIGINFNLKERFKLNQEEYAAISAQKDWASQRPWRQKDYPHIAAWLKINEKPLALVIEAAKYPEYYSPLVARGKKENPGLLIGALLPTVQPCREVATAITARAMLYTEEGKFEEAWRDLLACHRLARLVARGGATIEALAGIGIDSVANEADLAYLERAKLTSKQILDHLKDLQSLPPMPSMVGKIDVAERLTYLQTIQFIRRGGAGKYEDPETGKLRKPTSEELNALAMIDWESAIKNGDQWYDRLVAAMQIQNRAEREKEFDKIEQELETINKESTQVGSLTKLLNLIDEPGKGIGKDIGTTLIGLLTPPVRKLQGYHDRSVQAEHNQHLAFALAAYQLDHGSYPTRLTDLSPKYLPTVPDDLFSGKAMIYRPSEKGYLLYSVGINGKDDDGHLGNDDPPGDDLRVRMPLPPLKGKK